MAPGWLVGEKSRDDVEEMVKPFADGKFVVRKHDQPDQYVLCVVYRGKPTHHLMKKNGDGHYTINGKVYTETSSVETLVKHLGSKRAGWPVPLTSPCGGSGGGGGGGGGERWLHGDISREDSETLLAAGGDVGPAQNGRFLIRTRNAGDNEYVLSLVFKGKATQHLIKPNDAGLLTVNKKAYGNSANLAGLVAAISSATLPTGWPIRLSEGVDTSGKVFSLSGGDSPKKKKASTKKRSGKGSVQKAATGTPWLHPKMSNDAAAAKFPSPISDGQFMIRVHNKDAHQYAITVVFKNKVTHHLMVAPPDSESVVNKRKTGINGLEKTVEFLGKKQASINWPVALSVPIPNGKASTPKPKPAPPPESDEEEEDDSAATAAAEKKAAAKAEKKAAEAAAATAKAAEDAKAKAEADAKAAAEADAKAAQMKAAAEAEDNKVTGFYQLKNPFPAPATNDAGYVTIAPDAGSQVLAEARKLARETAANLSGETKTKYGVGMPLKVYGVTSSSTDDYEPETYDTSDGTGTEPVHMSMMMRNPYVAPVGVAGSKAGLDKLASVQKDVKVMISKFANADSRIDSLERGVDAAHEALKGEVAELHAKNAHLEKKIGLLEQLLLNTGGGGTSGDQSLINVTEVRVIEKKKQFGVAQGQVSSKPLKTDLVRASLLGKVRLLKDATFADCRHMIVDDFDAGEIPPSFKFYTVEDGEAELMMVHEKQESRTPVDGSCVYLVKDRQKSDDPRSRPHPFLT